MADEKDKLSSGLLHLFPSDNVVVILRNFKRGDPIVLDRQAMTIPCDLATGHKLALHPIAAGEDVVKYGAPIGIATCDIAKGDHVHLHNLASRYTVIQDMEGRP